MNEETRKAIEKATQRARTLLEEDFASQLSGTFDVQRSGVVAAKGGAHLSGRQAFQRDKIVAGIEHKLATGMTAAEAATDYLRDAAFTTINRFVALKMLESRELVQECITGGDQSVGYREFCGMAPGVALLPDAAGYRLYLECLFDEFSTEVRVLFDRRDAASVLWPSRLTFEALLKLLNGPELLAVWGEDETIGWVYQYFNSQQDRTDARYDEKGKPKAPGNSRELAVRNQFFTPRYVVQFLTDNTLGRTWFEMRGGDTALAERCVWLVRDKEVVTPRAKKDPRDLTVLDPACGSGHFLLYAFDLLLVIYEEAWQDQSASVTSRMSGRSLREDYPDLTSLRRAVPTLIVQHNLHGVDIDPRCAQIAALALWMRAQRAFKEFGMVARERTLITRTHIVVAEPMPGDEAMVDAFAARLEPPLLRDLFKKIVGEMRFAGELGALLRVEEGIATELSRAREQFVTERQTTGYLPGVEPARRQGELDLSGINDAQFFHEAETRIVDALRFFAESSAGGIGVRRRLFAEDAAQGIALIDLLQTRFDVVLMNPPFGDPTADLAVYLDGRFARSKYDLAAAFVERAIELCGQVGQVGWISPRTWMASAMMEAFRREMLYRDAPLSLVADLGIGVLDSALVETAACTASPAEATETRRSVLVYRLLASRTKEADLLAAIRAHKSVPIAFEKVLGLPRAAFGYWFPEDFFEALGRTHSFEPSTGTAKQGLATTDDFRFLRCLWEVKPANIGWGKRWVPFAKGGEYEPYYDDLHLVIDWDRDGAALKDYLVNQKGQAHWSRRIASAEYYGRPGLTYPERTTSDFSPRPLPAGSIFSATGQAVFLHHDRDRLPYLGLAYTRLFKQLVELFVGAGDASESGSAARHYTSGILNEMPIPAFTEAQASEVSEVVLELMRARREEVRHDEAAIDFVAPALLCTDVSLEDALRAATERYEESCLRSLEAASQLESWACKLYGISLPVADGFLSAEVCKFPTDYERCMRRDPSEVPFADLGGLVRALCERRGYKRAYTKKSYWANRVLELTSHYFEEHPANCRAFRLRDVSRSLATPVQDLVLYALGCAFGRWDLRYATAAKSWPSIADPFAELPRCAPGVLQGSDGLPLDLAAIDAEYPARVFADGLAVDDLGHSNDVAASVETIVRRMWPASATDVLHEVITAVDPGGSDLRTWLRHDLFAHHLARYSKSRRKAPIYWQLTTPTASYSVWLYFHALTRDTFFKIQNEFVGPKLAHEERQLETLRSELGSNPNAAARKRLVAQTAFVDELRAFLEEVKRIAPIWNPNADDGVIINFAPLWRLVPHHKEWQKELKATWEALCAREYDWAHLAMHLWPERVVAKCAADRSLAIAHGLEAAFWVEDAVGKWKPRATPTRPVAEIVLERTSAAVKAALKSLLDAPLAAAGAARGRGRRAASVAAH